MGKPQLAIRPIGQDFSLKARSYQALRDAIIKMNLYADDAALRLDERGLSEQLGISRTPLREAIARLQQEGLVEVIPRRGVFVVRKTKKQILEMITVWAALESMAAREIVARAPDKEIAKLREMFAKFEDGAVTADIDEYSEANIRFHQKIISICNCKLIAELTDNLFIHMRAIRARTISEHDRATRSIIDHMHIIEALEARDAELAERLVREHTLNLREHVARHVDLA